jgi:hypothetical protein
MSERKSTKMWTLPVLGLVLCVLLPSESLHKNFSPFRLLTSTVHKYNNAGKMPEEHHQH